MTGSSPADSVGTTDRQAIVIGAGLGGILTAAAFATSGWIVTVLERDRLPAGAEHRRGVPQDRQAHILLHRGLQAIDRLLPGFRAELLARDAVPFDSGRMPWLSEHGWLSNDQPSWEVVSATRPLMDAVARDLLRRLPGIEIRDGLRVHGLESVPGAWRVLAVAAAEPEAADLKTADPNTADPKTTDPKAAGPEVSVRAPVVVDASGRNSRLSHWLPGLRQPKAELVDARVGYAGQLHVARGEPPLQTGLAIIGRLPDGASGLALPVEQGHWMISAAGMGDCRPPRELAGYRDFLARLRDPAVVDLLHVLEPAGEVTVHRQTSNRRFAWGQHADWPAGLLVLGDALCSLDPIYGQGITVAAMQAERLHDALSAGRPVDRRLQRQLLAVTELPWSIATGNDLRYPTCPDTPSRSQQLSAAFTSRLGQLAAAGDLRATKAFSDVYHLMAPPTAFLRPALLAAAARPLPTRRLPRPAVLDQLSPAPPLLPPEDPADA